MSGSGSSVGEKSPMDRYHEYLTKNYVGGVDRFFSPTGFLEQFQRSVEVKTQKVRNHVYASSVDEAMASIEPIVSGGDGVFDLCSEPGSGKTSVLPFRFATKKVVVVLPTPIDAWNAYNMATGQCKLHIKGLKLGSTDNVVYTDSYLAAAAVLSGVMDYDVMIIDECDSDRGVTKFLAEVKVPGKLWIRMSATHGEFGVRKSNSFRVTECDDMPDARDGLPKLAEYVKLHHKRRSLLLAPDAESAEELHKLLPGSKLISTKLGLGNLHRMIVQQEGEGLFVADDTCARGINLNLDVLFDTQLVTEYAVARVITHAEACQRKGRVGRNKSGFYRSPGLKPADKGISDVDQVRHNVVRAIAQVPQTGPARLRVSHEFAMDNMCASEEPYMEFARSGRALSPDTAVTSGESALSRSASPRSEVFKSPRSHASSSSGGKDLTRVKVPTWMSYFSGHSATTADDGYVTVRNRQGRMSFERRKSSTSGSSGKGVAMLLPSDSASSVGRVISPDSSYSGRSRGGHKHRSEPTLPMSDDAPYAVVRHKRYRDADMVHVPAAPPIVDLNELTYDMDWPALIRDRLRQGGDLPTLVPPGSWRHTSATGLGTDWYARLDELAHRDTAFDDKEFEIVCRAWNRLVAQSWVKRTPGLSSESDRDRLEFCLRYFQSHFVLASAG